VQKRPFAGFRYAAEVPAVFNAAVHGFFLGLANGTVCLAYCAPALTPLVIGEAKGVRGNLSTLGLFLLGRLAGYLVFGWAAWLVGRLIMGEAESRLAILAPAYAALAVLMFVYGIRERPKTCPLASSKWRWTSWFGSPSSALPLWLGLFTGASLCPPFLAAFTSAAQSASLAGSLVFFAAFFVGTSIYLVPTVLLGVFNRVAGLATVGKLAALLISVYYLYLSIIAFGGLAAL
jgi:sulfite exporter TauE/SafE